MALFRWTGNGAGTKSDWHDGRNFIDLAGAAYPQTRHPGSVVAAGVTTWVLATPYVVGDVVESIDPVGNPYFFRCIDAGTSAGAEPVWPAALGATVIDNPGVNQIIWQNIGTNYAYDDVWCDTKLAVGAMGIAGGDYSADEGLQSFKVGPLYDKGVGSAGAALIIHHATAASDKHLIINGKSSIGIYIGIIGRQTLYNNLILDGNVIFSSGGGVGVKKLYGLICLKGTILISTGLLIWPPFHVGFVTAQNDVNLTIESGVAIFAGILLGDAANVTVSGGNTICNSGISYGLSLFNGYWVQNAAINKLDVYGGTFVWNSGDLTDAEVFNGLVDGSQSQIARNLDDCTVYEKGTLDLDNGVGNIAIVNGVTIIKGTVKFPRGQQLKPYP
jgi:hypothetical protein